MKLLLPARLCLLCSLFLNAGAALAADAAVSPSWTAAFERIGLEQGLSQSAVTSIHRDDLGFFWFGTQEGLNRYDGHGFKVFRHDPTDPDSLSSSSIEAIVGDDRGRLWLGTDDGGVNILDLRTGKVVVLRGAPSTRDSLSHDRVLDIAIAPDSSVWLGTERGLDRVDPHTLAVERMAEVPDAGERLAGKAVIRVLADDTGRIWAGTRDSGLYLFDDERLDHYGTDESDAQRRLAGDRITDMALGFDGSVWVTTRDGGLDRIGERGVSLLSAARPDGLPAAGLTALEFDGDGNLLVGSEAGELYRIGPKEPLNNPAWARRCLCGMLRFGLGERGLVVPNKRAQTSRSARKGPSRKGFAGKAASRALRSSAVATATVTRLAPHDLRLFRQKRAPRRVVQRFPNLQVLARHSHDPGDPNSISSGEILDILVDPAGVVWIGSYTGGVSKSKSLSGKVAHGVAGLPEASNQVVRAFWIEEDPREFWIGTSNGLAHAAADGGRREFFRHAKDSPRSLSDDVVYAVRRRQNGQLWVGTRMGLNRLRPGTRDFERYQEGDGRGLPDNRVRDLAEDTQGRLWVATEGGLARYQDDADRFTVFRSRRDDPGSLSSNELTALHADGQGFVWIGTNIAGLNRLDPETGSFTRFGAGSDGLSHHSVWDVVRTGDVVWAATFSGGLNRIDLPSGRITHFLERDGLVNNVVYRIVPDDRGRLWLSTNAGISVFDTDTERFMNYNPRDGLQNYEYNSNAAFRDGNGRIWFGGVDGIDVIDARAVETGSSIAVAALTDFRLFNRPVIPENDDRLDMDARIEYADRLVLGHQAKVFSIGLSALHFVNPDTNRLRYRLDGLHDDWLESNGGAHQVTFNSLDPGDYRFRVQAAARGAAWGPDRVLAIRIHPPPWRSPLAYAVYVAAALILLALVARGYWRRIEDERRRVEQLNAMVTDRTAELQLVNSKLEDTNQRLEIAIRRDPLTQLANRRELLEWLPREQALSLRAYGDWVDNNRAGPEPAHARLCLLVVDIDDFKQFNDTLGHLAGDRILHQFARQLHGQCRASDLVVRWGGEEFLIVLRASGLERARSEAERIRAAVQANPVRLNDGGEISLTCSIGFACYPFSTAHPDIGDWEDIVGLADAALYAAKQAGKNAWMGIGCPDGLSADQVESLLHDPEVRRCTGDRAMFWSSVAGPKSSG